MIEQFAAVGLKTKEGLSLTAREFVSYQKGYSQRIAYENTATVQLINMKQAQLSKSPKFITSSDLYGATEKKEDKGKKKLKKIGNTILKIMARKNSKKGGDNGK